MMNDLEETGKPMTSRLDEEMGRSIHQTRTSLSVDFSLQRPKHALLLVLVALSWILSMLTITKCAFFVMTPSMTLSTLQIDGEDVPYRSVDTAGLAQGTSGGSISYNDARAAGLISRAIYDADGSILGCVQLTDNYTWTRDTMFRLGRAFGMITSLVATLAMIFIFGTIIFGCCFFHWRAFDDSSKRQILERRQWNCARFLIAAAAVCQMFTFLPLGSETCTTTMNCKLGSTGAAAVINVLILAAVSLFTFHLPTPLTSAASGSVSKIPWLIYWSDRDGGKETLLGVDPFSAEFQSSEDAAAMAKSTSMEQGEPHKGVFEMDMQTDDKTFSLQNRFQMQLQQQNQTCAASVSSRGAQSQQSLEESLAGTLGIQSSKLFRLGFVLVVFLASAISLIGVERCTFVLIGPAGGLRSTFSAFGLYRRAMYHEGSIIGCLAYPDHTKENFDQAFQASRVFGAITSFLMSFISLLTVTQLLVRVAKEELWFLIRALLPFATLSQMLVFLGNRTDTCKGSEFIECHMGGTAMMMVFNSLLLGFLATIACVVPPPPHPLFRFSAGRQCDLQHSVHNHMGDATILKPGMQVKSDVSCGGKTQGDEESLERNRNDDMDVVQPFYSNKANHRFLSDQSTSVAPFPSVQGQVETISINVEFAGNEKKTIKTLTHCDGSKTITTIIEELSENESEADDEGEESVVYPLDDVELNEAIAQDTGLLLPISSLAETPPAAFDGEEQSISVQSTDDSTSVHSYFESPRSRFEAALQMFGKKLSST